LASWGSSRSFLRGRECLSSSQSPCHVLGCHGVLLGLRRRKSSRRSRYEGPRLSIMSIFQIPQLVKLRRSRLPEDTGNRSLPTARPGGRERRRILHRRRLHREIGAAQRHQGRLSPKLRVVRLELVLSVATSRPDHRSGMSIRKSRTRGRQMCFRKLVPELCPDAPPSISSQAGPPSRRRAIILAPRRERAPNAARGR